MKKIYCLLFFTGGAIYCLIEIVYRGYSHWSMFMAGGTALSVIYKLNSIKADYFSKCVFSATIITMIEFITGVMVNLILHLDVWDYSNQPFNILGQICPLFTLIWFFLSIPAFFICSLFQKKTKIK